MAVAAAGAAGRGRGGFAGGAAGVVHGLAAIPRRAGRGPSERARVRGFALGGRGAARVPGASVRVGGGGAPAPSLHCATGAVPAAAGLGKVFWVGALAEIGGRDQGELELALHELARKELVRPARVSSMEGESEYPFWHLLVRDVAYGQIPRPERARRHRSAATWIERQAGDRVEDLAEVLAHHYLQALELARAAGDTELAEELALPARRFLALAGERALGLDTTQAEARLTRALELTPSDDPGRPDLLVRWADAVYQAGRPREAAAALDEALDLFRTQGEKEAEARALILLARVTHRLAGGRQVALAADAVELLEQEPPGPALVAAHTELASAHFLTGVYGEAIAAAERAVTLAQMLGRPARWPTLSRGSPSASSAA